jgi:diacylglycerol kinase (ATP)
MAAAAADYDVVVAAGGDGTVHEVANGLMRGPAPRPRLGIVPLGTGNDIARNLGLGSAAAGWAALTAGRDRPLDLLRIECRAGGQRRVVYGVLNCGIGFGGEVVARTTARVKRLCGPQLAYLVGTLSALRAWDSPWMMLASDLGVRRGRYFFVALGNGEWESGGTMRLSPGARMDDGLADLTAVAHGAKLLIAGHLPKIAWGGHLALAQVEHGPTRALTVAAARPLPIQADGDVVGTTPCRVTVVAGALRVA